MDSILINSTEKHVGAPPLPSPTAMVFLGWQPLQQLRLRHDPRIGVPPLLRAALQQLLAELAQRAQRPTFHGGAESLGGFGTKDAERAMGPNGPMVIKHVKTGWGILTANLDLINL